MRGLFVFVVKYLFTVVLLAALAEPAGFASSFILLSRDELVSSADAILVGRIDFIKSAADENGNLHSFIAVNVQRDLFGQVPEQTTIYLKEPGGRFRGISGWAFGSPEFEVGEDVVLFVKLQPDGFFRVAHMFQGKFRLLPLDRLHRVVKDAVVSRHESRSFETLQQIQEMARDTRPLLGEFVTQLNLPDAENLVQFSLRGVSDQGVSGEKGEASSSKFYALGGGGIRWNEFDSGTSVTFYVNPTASPLSATDTMAAVNSALQAWNSVANTKILLANGGQTALRGYDRSDNTNVITFGDPQNFIQDPTNCSGTLAITYISFSSSLSRTVNGTAFRQIFQADLVFNNGFDCFFTLSGNLAEVLGHEMGHAIGFGHSSENPSEPNPVLKDALMYFRAHGDGRGASPRSDDIAAAQFVYPSGAPPSQAPIISALAPTEAAAGSGGFTLSITGTNFVSNSTVQWNGQDRPTTFVSSAQLQIAISAADLNRVSTVMVAVTNPSPGGGASNASAFSVTAPLYYFAQFGNGSNFVSSLVATNASRTETANGSISLFDEQGQPLAVSFNGQFPASAVSFTIPPLGSATFTSDGGGSLIAGSARVSANIPLAVVVKFTAPGLGITGVAESAPLAALMTPVVRDATRGVNTGIAITNTKNSEVRFILSLRGLDGLEVLGGSLSLSLVAGGHFSKFINELFPNASTANFQGSLVVTVTTAGGAIAATAIQVGSSPGEFTTLPVVAADPAPVARDLIFAQFGNGSGFTSSLFLNNPLGSTNAGDVSFFDDDGNPLPISIGGAAPSQRVPFRIQPQGGAVFTTNGLGSLVSGSTRVSAANAIGGVLRFAFPGLGTAGVGASPPVSGFITPVTKSVSRNLSTGVAIASAGLPVTLTLTLRNKNGELVPGGQTTLQLRANGHRARFIEELFTGVDMREFEGTLTVTAEGGDIAGTALQLGSKAGEFTTLPVTAIR